MPNLANDKPDPEWLEMVVAIEHLIESGEYDWAYETLDGIAMNIRKRERVTDKQREAIYNIQSSTER